MKARELVDQLQKYDPDEEVIALVWFKDTFDFDNNDDLTLTDEAWLKVVKEMEEQGGIDSGDQQTNFASTPTSAGTTFLTRPCHT